MVVLLIIITVSLSLLLHSLIKILQNYVAARHVGLPILISPFSLLNPFWVLTQSQLTPIFKWLDTNCPLPIFSFANYSKSSWYFHDRHTLHSKYGPAFLIVSPGDTQLIVADAAAAEDILARRKDFVKSPDIFGPLEIFGPNVDTVNGDRWARHRRITAPPFNERNSGVVWDESLKQAEGMLSSWLGKSRKKEVKVGGNGVANTLNDILTLALHVLTAAGFGKKYAFEGGVQEVGEGHEMSYRDALRVVLEHVFGVIITSALLAWAPDFLMPAKIRRLRKAVEEFKRYMGEMVEEERNKIRAKGTTDGERANLMSVLVRAAEAEAGGKGKGGLSNEEIYGNLFMYNLAGHDTSANTLAYAITMLATDSKLQDWISEEINSVFAGKQNVQDWNYEEAFPRLKRCVALMYETLRLYGPIIFIPRKTPTTPQHLTVAGKPYMIPAKTFIILNIPALHSSPSHYGPDPLTFRPDRWISASPNPDSRSTSFEEEVLTQPETGALLPWGSGPRVCPGKKFAQVEFVAVIARLFQKHQVKPSIEAGETRKQAERRVRAAMEDSELNITLSMRKPDEIRLVWSEKE